MFDTITPIAASFVATAALVAALWTLQQPRTRRLVGPAADGWETLRSVVLPSLDRLLRRRAPGQHYAAYELGAEEVVGLIDAPPEAVEQLLWEAGYRRNPLAALKTLPEGRVERGSWAFRDGLLAREQTHIVLFAGVRDGETLVAAHQEASAINPLVAMEHYRAEGYDVPAGERAVRKRLDEGIWVEE